MNPETGAGIGVEAGVAETIAPAAALIGLFLIVGAIILAGDYQGAK